MKVKIEPDWSSAGSDHNIKDGYRVLDAVVEAVYLDGEQLTPDTDRYYEVSRIEDHAPESIRLFTQ